jgi:hypothetical protein
MGIFSKSSTDKNGEYFQATSRLNEYLDRQLISEVIDKKLLKDAEKKVDQLSNKYLEDDSIMFPKSSLLQAKATISMLHGDPRQALQICELAIEMDGDKTMPGIYRLMGMAHVWLEDFKSAEKSLKQAKKRLVALNETTKTLKEAGTFAELGVQDADDEPDLEEALIDHWLEAAQKLSKE